MANLIRIDKNGTKYYESNVCPKCGGKGILREYDYVDGGVCFLCGGSGQHYHKWVERTAEYEQKLAERRLARARKHAPEKNAQFFKKLGLSEDGKCYVVMGDTYSIKDELKEAGAKYGPMGWHFAEPNDKYDTFELSVDEFADKNEAGEYYGFAPWKVEEVVKQKKAEHAPKTASEYIGEVGEKVEIEAAFKGMSSYSTYFTHFGETVYLYKFVSDGNTVVWKTSKEMDFEEKTYLIKGTVKEHKEYNGDKETVLVRCKIS